MPAYIIVDVKINDREVYEEYKKLTTPTVTAYGGEFIIRGGKTETLEGTWNPERFVVLKFPDATRAKQWWSSPEYAKAKSLRQSVAATQMILADGTANG